MSQEKEIQTGVMDIPESEVFDELRGDISTVDIYRNGAIVDKVRPEEVNGDLVLWIKEKYGGGSYTVVLRGKDGKFKKRLSFKIEGKPKTEEEKETGKEPALQLIEKLIEKLEEKKNDSTNLATFQMMMEMQRQNFQMMLEMMKGQMEVLKNQGRERGIFESALEKVFSNPEVLLAAGGGAWKLLSKILSKKDEVIELVKLAKDDPELKELAVSILGAKYGGTGGILERVLSNPEILTKTLEIINKSLEAKTLGQNPTTVMKRELQKISPQPITQNSQQQAETPEEVSVQEIIAVGTKILSLADEGKTSEEIVNALSQKEIDILLHIIEKYDVNNHERLIEILGNLPVPSFAISGYIDAIKKHSEVIDQIFSIIFRDFFEF